MKCLQCSCKSQSHRINALSLHCSGLLLVRTIPFRRVIRSYHPAALPQSDLPCSIAVDGLLASMGDKRWALSDDALRPVSHYAIVVALRALILIRAGKYHEAIDLCASWRSSMHVHV